MGEQEARALLHRWILAVHDDALGMVRFSELDDLYAETRAFLAVVDNPVTREADEG